MIAPITQGARLALGGDQHDKASAETLTSVVEASVADWNHLILRVLPPVAHRMLEAIYPLRSRLVGELTRRSREADSSARAKLVWALARRFGRLEAFRALPGDARFPKPRADAIEFLARLQDEYEQPGFVPF